MTSSNQIVERIRADIVSGVFPGGAKLPIDQLASRYATSHMPIREALRRLAGDGMIVLQANRSAYVRQIDENFVEELMELRASLEASLARRVARHITPAQIGELRAIEAKLEQAVQRRDYEAALAANREFHDHINAISGTEELASLVSRNWLLLATLWQKYGYDQARFAGVINDHQQIILAFEHRDERAAEILMAAHVYKTKLSLLRLMRGATPAPAGQG